jgi:hypothetical protein
MYQINSEWHRLKTCVVGRSWSPEFYSWIKNVEIRNYFETIASETNEDLDTLAVNLNALGVHTLRPTADVVDVDVNNLPKSPLAPRDHLLMLGNKLVKSFYNNTNPDFYKNISDHVIDQGNQEIEVNLPSVCGATVYQLTDRVFFSNNKLAHEFLHNKINNKKLTAFHQEGHIDGWFCPVTPGLIIANDDPVNHELLELFFKMYFNNWEIVYIRPSLEKLPSFKNWQARHTGSWWLPGQESNIKLIEFVDYYFKNSLGYVAETVFELNMLIIDDKNAVISGYNQQIFDALKRHQVTPHVSQFRHKCFWDNGLHCVTSDLHREKI